MAEGEKGRPTKYKPEYADQAYRLCLLGHTDSELSEFFEVNEDTIHEWKKRHEDFSESVKRGKLVADANVAEGLYKRAIGFEYDEVTFEKVNVKIDGVEEDDDIKIEPYKKKDCH